MANCRYLQIPFPFLTYISPSVLSMGIVGRKIVTRRTAQFSTFNYQVGNWGKAWSLTGTFPLPWPLTRKNGFGYASTRGVIRASYGPLVEFKQRVLLLLLAEPDFIYNVPCTKYYFAATYFFISYRRGLPDSWVQRYNICIFVPNLGRKICKN